MPITWCLLRACVVCAAKRIKLKSLVSVQLLQQHALRAQPLEFWKQWWRREGRHEGERGCMPSGSCSRGSWEHGVTHRQTLSQHRCYELHALSILVCNSKRSSSERQSEAENVRTSLWFVDGGMMCCQIGVDWGPEHFGGIKGMQRVVLFTAYCVLCMHSMMKMKMQGRLLLKDIWNQLTDSQRQKPGFISFSLSCICDYRKKC